MLRWILKILGYNSDHLHHSLQVEAPKSDINQSFFTAFNVHFCFSFFLFISLILFSCYYFFFLCPMLSTPLQCWSHLFLFSSLCAYYFKIAFGIKNPNVKMFKWKINAQCKATYFQERFIIELKKMTIQFEQNIQ